MESKQQIATAIDGHRKAVYKTDRATYNSLPPLGKLIADACIRAGTLVIAEG
jgi:hypothetical protein